MTIKEHILKELRKGPKTKSQLMRITGSSYDGLRGRLSELRQDGHIIVHKNNRYTLDDSADKKIISWIERNQVYGKPVSISILSTTLKVSEDDVKDGIRRLFKSKSHDVIQLSKDSFKIYQKL